MNKILFVGCGNMGGAIVQGMLNTGNFNLDDIIVLAPEEEHNNIRNKYNIKHLIANLPNYYIDYIVFAIKPQILDIIITDYVNYINNVDKKHNTTLISIAAGKTIKYFKNYFPNNLIIRTMPNLPAIVNEGITGIIANDIISPPIQKLINMIFTGIGDIVWADKEEDIDTIAAMAGSSPAYFCLLTEIIVDFGITKGLQREVAKKLAQKTLSGTGVLCSKMGFAPEDLRAMVTSKNGVTDAAIKSFQEDNNLKKIVYMAMEAAIKRSKELAND